MDAIFSSTALRDRQAEVKKAAREGLVRITENGAGAFVFCSDEVFQLQLDEAAERALHCAAAEAAIARGRASYASGDYVEGAEAAFAEAARRRSARG
jgi:PHD/YefM family antitoxin component YafN of YafNO toxin-antitoxin module